MRFLTLALAICLMTVNIGGAFAAQGHGDVHASPVHAESHDAEAHYDDHHDKVEGLPQLDPTWYPSQIFWLAVTFLVMFIPFKFRVLPDLSSTIERRRDKIEGDLLAAHNLKKEAEETHKTYEAIVLEARQKSSALFTNAEEKIKELEQEAYASFYKKVAEKMAETEEEVADAKVKAMDTVNDIAAEIASAAAEKLVNIKTNKDAAADVVQNIHKKRAA